MRKIVLVLAVMMYLGSAHAHTEQEKLLPMTGITLTKEQRTKISTLNKGVREEIKSLQENSALDAKERHLKIKEVRAKQEAAIKEILTPEQYIQRSENIEKIRNQNQK